MKDEEKVFEALFYLPGIAEKVEALDKTIKANNKTVSDNVRAISTTVIDLEGRLSNLERALSSFKVSVDTAVCAMKKEVTVKVPPVTITQEKLSNEELETMAEILAEKNKKKKRDIWSGLMAISFIFMIIIGVKAEINYNNDYRGWGARYVKVGMTAGDLHPGDRFLSVKQSFSNGRKSRRAMKRRVEAEEEKYNEQYRKNARLLSRDITNALQEESVVLDYYVVKVDSLSYEAFVILRPVDQETRIAAHILKNGDVYINWDSDIVTTAEEAKNHPGRRTWKKMGNYKSE